MKAAAEKRQLRNIVTSFLEHQGQILLLKRSSLVRTFPGRWAGISGSVEEGETPLQCAVREIGEETELVRTPVPTEHELVAIESVQKDLPFRLVRSGRPLHVPTARYDTTFVVHPFLFKISPSFADRIVIDWEHTETQFISPDQIKSFETVPDLDLTYDRVNIKDGKAFSDLEEVKNNHTDGAAVLASRALSSLSEALQSYEIGSTSDTKDHEAQKKQFIDYAKNLAWHWTHVRPAMAPIGTAVASAVFDAFSQASPSTSATTTTPTISDLQARFIREAQRKLEAMRESKAAIARQFNDAIHEGSTILTHSNSSTVTLALSQCHNKRLNIYVTESSPLNEGRRTATQLKGLQNNAIEKVTLLPDAAIYAASPLDACVVGADAILADGTFVNKTGTALVSMVAKAKAVPVYVLCDTTKISAQSSFDPELAEPFDERVKAMSKGENITYYNPTFEATPLEDHVQVVTENGILDRHQIVALSKQVAKTLQFINE